MCLYLTSVCLLSRILKETYFREHLSVVPSKYSLCDMENNTQCKLFSMSRYSSNGKGVVYGPQWDITLMEKALWSQ